MTFISLFTGSSILPVFALSVLYLGKTRRRKRVLHPMPTFNRPHLPISTYTLEKLNDGRGEGEFSSFGLNVRGGEFVLNHELSQIPDDFGRRRHFHQIAQQQVRLHIRLAKNNLSSLSAFSIHYLPFGVVHSIYIPLYLRTYTSQ